MNEVQWISRVPESIKEAKKAIEDCDPVTMTKDDNGYSIMSVNSSYAGIQQRWLVVHSEQAAKRETMTFHKKLKKLSTEQDKALWHMSKREFACLTDAENELAKYRKSLKYHSVQAELIEEKHHDKKGRPAKDAVAGKSVWRIQGALIENQEHIAKELSRKGFFIISTTDLDTKELSDEEMLSVYKSQGVSVERGFRFLKDPMFYAESLYLNSPERIMALLMVMTLSLLVYSLAEKKLTVKSQVKKDTDNPTLRWVFQKFFYTPIITLEFENGTLTTQSQLLIRQEYLLSVWHFDIK
jgi:transposase